jgi:thioredoxin reductase (NADPH)
MTKCDLLIIGAGPAGLSAGLYASRYKINHLVVGELIGGEASTAFKICNFPTEKEISGRELAEKMEETVGYHKVNIIKEKVSCIEKKNKVFLINLKKGENIEAKAIILATGTKRKKLGILKEDFFRGRGVHYCATCDGPFYKDKIVGVVGGGNAALTAAIFLADICSNVYLICRENKKEDLPAETIWIENVLNNKKIKVLWGENIKELIGDKFLEAVILKGEDGKSSKIKINGLFVEIGSKPNFPEIKFPLDLAPNGEIKVNPSQETSVPGFFAAGDVSSGSNGLRQIITALSEGMIAADSVFKYLKCNK